MGESLGLEVMAAERERGGARAGRALDADARAQRVPRPGARAALAALPRRRGRAADRAHAAADRARPDRAPAGRAGADRAPGVRRSPTTPSGCAASGRHLRRGLLLHGPPGTGKTLTAMYLAAQMPGRTVVLLTGQSLGAVGASIDLATALQPAMVVLEDVDLVAMDRVVRADERDPVRAAQRDGRPRRGPRRPVRADHEPRGPARARARRAARPDRPGRRAAAPRRRRAPPAARALRRRASTSRSPATSR